MTKLADMPDDFKLKLARQYHSQPIERTFVKGSKERRTNLFHVAFILSWYYWRGDTEYGVPPMTVDDDARYRAIMSRFRSSPDIWLKSNRRERMRLEQTVERAVSLRRDGWIDYRSASGSHEGDCFHKPDLSHWLRRYCPDSPERERQQLGNQRRHHEAAQRIAANYDELASSGTIPDLLELAKCSGSHLDTVRAVVARIEGQERPSKKRGRPRKTVTLSISMPEEFRTEDQRGVPNFSGIGNRIINSSISFLDPGSIDQRRDQKNIEAFRTTEKFASPDSVDDSNSSGIESLSDDRERYMRARLSELMGKRAAELQQRGEAKEIPSCSS